MPSPMPSHAARRQAAVALDLLRVLEKEVVLRDQVLDQYLSGYYRQHREFGARDRRFFSALAFAWFRWRGWLPAPTAPDALQGALAWLLDASAPHPAIAHMLTLTQHASSAPQPLGAAALAAKANGLGQWLNIPPPPLAALAPAWLAPALFYPPELSRAEHQQRCWQAFQTRPPTWLRAPQASAAQVLASLQKQYPAACHPRLTSAISLPSGISQEILQQMPELEIQDLASQAVGLCCAPQTGEAWWDACAGSGGKSFHLAALLAGGGAVMATDIRETMRQAGQRRLARNRLRNITFQAWDGSAATAPRRAFNGVLLDAPCSGIGTWPRNPDARWRTRAEQITTYASLQGQLLRVCAQKLQAGGRLVYAVCTLTQAETVAVIEAFLADRPDFKLEPMAHPLTGQPSSGQLWFWPENCNGMFIASLRQQASQG